MVLKTSSSHEEGCTRRWSLNSNRFIGRNGRVTGVEVEEVEWLPAPDGGRPVMKPTGRKEVIKADLVLLAMGFLKPQLPQLPQNAVVAGDAATGPSLVVKCIAAGRRAAADIDRAEALRNPANDRWELAEALRNPANDRWELAEALRNPANDRWETAEALRNPANDRWETAEALRNLANDRWPDNEALRRLANDRWQT